MPKSSTAPKPKEFDENSWTLWWMIQPTLFRSLIVGTGVVVIVAIVATASYLTVTNVCFSTSQCPDFQACVAGSCVECEADDQCRDGQQCSSGFCVEEEVRTWTIFMDATDYNAMMGDLSGDWESYPCQVESSTRGRTYNDGMISLKGSESKLEGSKKSFALTYEYQKPLGLFRSSAEQSYPGFGHTTTLSAEWHDPSFLRHVLGLHVYSQLTQVFTPRTAYTKVYFDLGDGEPVFYGLMIEEEDVAPDFLDRNGRLGDSGVFHADPVDDVLVEMSACQFVPLDVEKDYKLAFPKVFREDTDDRHGELVSLIEDDTDADWFLYLDVGEVSTKHIKRVIWADYLTTYLAVQNVLQAGDNIKKNYRLGWQTVPGELREAWEWYPDVLTHSMGCQYTDEYSGICQEMEFEGTLQAGLVDVEAIDEFWTPKFGAGGTWHLLYHLMYADPDTASEIEDKMCALVTSQTWTTDLERFLGVAESLIAPVVADDPNLHLTDAFNVTETINGTVITSDELIEVNVTSFADSVEQVRAFINARGQYIESELDCSTRNLEPWTYKSPAPAAAAPSTTAVVAAIAGATLLAAQGADLGGALEWMGDRRRRL